MIEGFRAINDACHAEGAAMIQQLYHVGQHGDFDNSYQPSWSPSGLPSYHDADGSHEMSAEQIYEIIDSFVEAAARAQRSGFDGVEIFAAYHALVDQFWLPWSNRRHDDWGGSFDNRMRFSELLLRRVRERVGDEFVIGLAVSVDPVVEVAMQIDALCEIVAWHDERLLMDYVTCGTGSYFNFSSLIPTYQFADKLGVSAAEALKAVVRRAKVQAESHIRHPDNADYVIASGQADLVSIVRGQIADPHLVAKTLDGRADDVRGCISCNQMCWGRRSRDYWISCLVNPSAGREFEWGGDRFEPAAASRSILVVGGGPAGMEAARVAAERGHRVTLAEAGPKLGGNFRLAGRQPRRDQITELIEWYERQLTRLDVQLLCNSPMGGDDVTAFGADAIVVATGSQPDGRGFQRQLPEHRSLPGLANGNVHSIEAVLSHNAATTPSVLLLDDTGDWRGGGTAWFLAERGHEVVIVTGWPMVGYQIQRTAGDWKLRSELASLGVTWHTEAVVTEWHGDGATVRSLLDGREERVEVGRVGPRHHERARDVAARRVVRTRRSAHRRRCRVRPPGRPGRLRRPSSRDEAVTDPLLQPFTLRHLTIRNRIFSSAHEPAYSEDGMPKDRYRLYHEEKARGGIGLTMTAGSAVVAEDSPPRSGTSTPTTTRSSPGSVG